MYKRQVFIPWQTKVLTWHELFEEVSKTFDGNLTQYMAEFLGNLFQHNDLDERDRSLAAVDEIVQMCIRDRL